MADLNLPWSPAHLGASSGWTAPVAFHSSWLLLLEAGRSETTIYHLIKKVLVLFFYQILFNQQGFNLFASVLLPPSCKSGSFLLKEKEPGEILLLVLE